MGQNTENSFNLVSVLDVYSQKLIWFVFVISSYLTGANQYSEKGEIEP